MQYERLVSATDDHFSLSMKDQYLDLGAESREMAKLSHNHCIRIGQESEELKKYEDLIYTKVQVKNHLNHCIQGLVSYNKIIEKNLVNQRVLDCIPEKLQDDVLVLRSVEPSH